MVTSESLPDPPGYSSVHISASTDARESNPDLIEKVFFFSSEQLEVSILH
jgi:hypothetical protein